MHNFITFWKRIRTKRRVSVMDDRTLTELWSFRLSSLGLVITVTLLIAVTLIGLSLAIVFTPVRNILPGYNQNLRNQLISESARLDSLSNSVTLQRKYLDVIRDITTGNVKPDSTSTSDSMQLVFQDKLMQAKMEVSEEFVEQYEQKEKDNLTLFDVQSIQPSVTTFRPAHGVIVKKISPQTKQYGVQIKTPAKENITAVLAGTIIYASYELNNTYTIVLQHANYSSVYRNVAEMTKNVGTSLKAGETFGVMGSDGLLEFELWKEGTVINPEDVIVF